MKNLSINRVLDLHEAYHIYTQAFLTSDKNSKNYTPSKFEDAWWKWLAFYTLTDGNEVVAFCGVRDYNTHARIFDRYHVYPEYRRSGIAVGEMCKLLIKPSLENLQGKIPFFSIEHANKRNAIKKAIDSINTVLEPEQQFHLLPGLYLTAIDSWQNVAIQKPHTMINLPRKDI